MTKYLTTFTALVAFAYSVVSFVQWEVRPHNWDIDAIYIMALSVWVAAYLTARQFDLDRKKEVK
jgi:hypothetical protein